VIQDELADDPANNNVVQTGSDVIYANNPGMSGPGPFAQRFDQRDDILG
jgi:hypothetical protein